MKRYAMRQGRPTGVENELADSSTRPLAAVGKLARSAQSEVPQTDVPQTDVTGASLPALRLAQRVWEQGCLEPQEQA